MSDLDLTRVEQVLALADDGRYCEIGVRTEDLRQLIADAKRLRELESALAYLELRRATVAVQGPKADRWLPLTAQNILAVATECGWSPAAKEGKAT